MYRSSLRSLVRGLAVTTLGTVLLSAVPMHAAPTQPAAFASPRFEQVWNATDKAVAEGQSTHSWLWGPQPGFSLTETYQQSSNGQRLVQYFDKARMEINNPSITTGPLNGVTSGLLVVEMVSGRVKQGDGIGSEQNKQREPFSTLPVAGDWVSSVNQTPNYASFHAVATVDNGYRDARTMDARVGTTFSLNGVGGYQQNLAQIAGTDVVLYDETTGHNIPRVFNDFINNSPIPGQVAFGHPITDAYWIRAVIAGVERDVLIQLFERRTITYTPANPKQFQVEMGNVGQHYLFWRYGGTIASPQCTTVAVVLPDSAEGQTIRRQFATVPPQVGSVPQTIKVNTVRSITRLGQWYIIQASFVGDAQPGIFVVEQTNQGLRGVAVWGGVTKEPEQIRTYLASKAPAAPAALIHCLVPTDWFIE